MMGLGQGWAWGHPGEQGKGRHKPPGHGPTSFGHTLPLETWIGLSHSSTPALRLCPRSTLPRALSLTAGMVRSAYRTPSHSNTPPSATSLSTILKLLFGRI